MRIYLVLAVALALVAGCRGSENIPLDKLPRLVLQPDDVPDLTMFDEGRQSRADLPPGERGDPHRFGRRGGWKARYRRAGSAETRGPLVVESRADLFASEGGAEADLDSARRALEREWRRVHSAAIGDGTSAATTTQQAVAGDVRFYTIAWRDNNVTASILVQGFEGKVALEDAVALARKQQKRIDAAKEE